MVKDRSFYRSLAGIAAPLALQNLITFGIGLADNFMVGSLGDQALSGVFLSNQIQWMLQMLNTGLGAALGVLLSQYLGRRDLRSAAIVINIAAAAALVAGLGFTASALLVPRRILGLFSDEAPVIEQGLAYLGIVCFSYVFCCLNSVFLAALRCAQNTRIGFISAAAGFCVNVFLNWVLIFGRLGAPALGVRGAALATVCARAVELGVSLYYLRFRDVALKWRFGGLRKRSPEIRRGFFKYGFPVILGDLCWGMAGMAQVAILGRLGTEVLAANTIAANLHQLFSVAVYGLANASGVIIGRTVGAGDYGKLKPYADTLQVVFVCFGLITALLIFAAKDLILALGFSGISNEARAYALQFLTVFSVVVVGTSYQMSVLTGIVRAGGATHFVLINDLFHVWLLVIPSALLSAFVFRFPPVVTFACLKSDQIIKCIAAAIKLNRYDWMKQL